MDSFGDTWTHLNSRRFTSTHLVALGTEGKRERLASPKGGLASAWRAQCTRSSHPCPGIKGGETKVNRYPADAQLTKSHARAKTGESEVDTACGYSPKLTFVIITSFRSEAERPYGCPVHYMHVSCECNFSRAAAVHRKAFKVGSY